MTTVAEMRAQTRPGRDGLSNSRRIGRSVPQGNYNIRAHEPFDEDESSFVLRRQGDQTNPPSGSVLPALKFIPIRSTDMLTRVRTSRPLFSGNIGPFQMYGWECVGDSSV